jgi:hypothetical protein
MATESPMPVKADPAWIHAPNAFSPMVDANCHGFVNRSAIGQVYGGLWKGVNTAELSGTVVARVYPASDSLTVARPYLLL